MSDSYIYKYSMPSRSNLHFYRMSSYASTVLGVLNLSVCLSQACFVTKLNSALRIFCYHTLPLPHYSFLTPTVVGGLTPFHLKFALKVNHPLEIHRLRQISAYNVSTVRDSEKSSVMTNRRLTSDHWLSNEL